MHGDAQLDSQELYHIYILSRKFPSTIMLFIASIFKAEALPLPGPHIALLCDNIQNPLKGTPYMIRLDHV